MDVIAIKQRFDIIGNSDALNRAIDIAAQVAATDLSVLVTGESGVGKEFIPKIIHAYSARKHNKYIAVNCGAIPEGTIDSELFGHKKGSFTGALEDRKGYFQEANGGTLFLDEVAELPLSTQVRLLRVLETGEFLRVGSSDVQKTDVRVIAATNVNLPHAIRNGKFREDLYYRLNTVPILVPALRERPGDISLLFRKFASDFANRYKMPVVRLDNSARALLEHYRWPGNIRQLKNVAEQLSVLAEDRNVSSTILEQYLPPDNPMNLPVPCTPASRESGDFMAERDLLYKIIFQLRNEMEALRQRVEQLDGKPLRHPSTHLTEVAEVTEGEILPPDTPIEPVLPPEPDKPLAPAAAFAQEESAREELAQEASLSLNSLEKELMRKALEKHNGHRKAAAKELGVSERTLYRKIKEYDLDA